MFAKLYETDIGQILVKIDDGEKGAEIKLYFEPEGLGVCSINFNWPDDDNKTQWEKADKAFDKMTKERCFDMVKSALDKLEL